MGAFQYGFNFVVGGGGGFFDGCLGAVCAGCAKESALNFLLKNAVDAFAAGNEGGEYGIGEEVEDGSDHGVVCEGVSGAFAAGKNAFLFQYGLAFAAYEVHCEFFRKLAAAFIFLFKNDEGAQAG